MMTLLTIKKIASIYSDKDHRYSKKKIVLRSYLTQPYGLLSLIGPSAILRPIYRSFSLLYNFFLFNDYFNTSICL